MTKLEEKLLGQREWVGGRDRGCVCVGWGGVAYGHSRTTNPKWLSDKALHHFLRTTFPSSHRASTQVLRQTLPPPHTREESPTFPSKLRPMP